MLTERVETWAEEWKQQGLTEGRAQGIKEGIKLGEEQGIRDGEEKVLRRQLKRRFGALPGWVEERLAKASPTELDTWTDRILEHRTLEEILRE